MRIVFNSVISGCGNNGGTRTIFKSAETLRTLGHDCEIIANVDNFTWFEHRPVISYAPSGLDAAVAVACSDVEPTLNIPAKKKAWFIRAHEDWSFSNEDLGYLYRDPRFLNIVNSKGLQNKLKKEFHSDSVVVYQGLDFDWWQDRRLRKDDKIRIGCLHTKQPRKRWKDFVALANILGHDKYEYVGMGNAVPPDTSFLASFIENADVEQLNQLYSSCHIWFAPTDSEGLHNPPMEAALCGCLVVCSDHPLNGMVLDYAFNNETAMVYRFGDIEHAAKKIKNPAWNLVPAMRKCLKTEIGSREDNMRKMVEYLEAL
jgi:glycosyltransferase involved in cell wall biosynthesis